MATGTQWTESPSGVWRNHALSTRLRWNAIQRMVFAPFPTPEPGYGAGRGENITIPRMGAITEPTSPVLSEDERIPEDKHTISVTSITVQEIGRAHRVTEKFLKLSKYSMKNKIHQWLEKQLGLSLDTLIAAAFKGCKVKYTPLTATTNQIDTAGAVTQAAGSNWDMFHADEGVDYMYNTLRVPFIGGNHYVGIFNWKSLRGILNDPLFVEWYRYQSPKHIYPGEEFRVGPFRYISTNHTNALSATKGTGSILGEGVCFGDDAVAAAIATDPHVRVAKTDDYGRSLGAAWYGMLAYGEPFPTSNAGEGKIVHVTST